MIFQLAEKLLVITNLDSNINNYKMEINTLKFQLGSLKKLLEENNLNLILKELMEAQEKGAYYQGQYHMVILLLFFYIFHNKIF